MNLDEKSYLERIADALEVINGGASTRTIDITENGTIDVKNFAYANVNVGKPIVYIPEQTVELTPLGGGAPFNAGLLVDVTLDPENPIDTLPVVINGNDYTLTYTETLDGARYVIQNPPIMIMYDPNEQSWTVMAINEEITLSSVVSEGGGSIASDFSTADVTLANTTGQVAQFELAYISDDINSDTFVQVEPGADVVVKAILYKGVCVCDLLTSGAVELYGSIHRDNNSRIIITGDGTILVKTSGGDIV